VIEALATVKESTMSETQISAPAGIPFVDITREFDAPRDLVFRAWTDPSLLKQWLGPENYEMIIDQYDVRAGGSYRYIHRDPEGNEYAFRGVFHNDPSPDSFVQTFEFEGAPGHVSLDALTLEERDGRTISHTHSVFQSVEARDAMIENGMADGVNQGFVRLDDLLTQLAAGERLVAVD
jgi:uncharacterized protein YndB with AHSA1/START domain